MRRIILLLAVFFITSCTHTKNTDMAFEQKAIYKNWVLSRCLSYILESEKQDALNSASAYLEQSKLSVEALLRSEPLIEAFLSREYSGSISGTFNTKKCIDLYNSPQLESLYQEIK